MAQPYKPYETFNFNGQYNNIDNTYSEWQDVTSGK